MTTDNNDSMRTESSRKRSKAYRAGGALLITGLAVGMVGSTVATWAEEEAVGQQFRSGEGNFDVELSVDGGETWQSNAVEYNDDEDMVINFSELQFDGETNGEGVSAFSPGQSKSAEFIVRAVGDGDDTAIVWVSDVGYEGNAEVFAWEVVQSSDSEDESKVLAASDSLADFSEENGDGAILSAGDTLSFEVNVKASDEINEFGRTTGYWVISSQEENAYEHDQS